jgi:large subunit ribosomal protein L21
MYAIIETGGKQFRVEEGDVLDVELLNFSSKDKEIQFDQVLLFNNGKNAEVGRPLLKNCQVFAQILDEVRGPKVISFKYKKRKSCKRKVGHRQNYSRIKITKIKATEE